MSVTPKNSEAAIIQNNPADDRQAVADLGQLGKDRPPENNLQQDRNVAGHFDVGCHQPTEDPVL